jgi:hypothetical protein
MTRRRDMMCEDIFGCTHEPETPIIDWDGSVLHWVCRCGTKTTSVEEIRKQGKEREKR